MIVNTHVRYWLLGIIAFVLYCQKGVAASLVDPGPVVEKIEQVGGQTLKGIKSLIQDKSGFMWLASSEGLLRFDGLSLKRFVHDANNPHSLAHNDIRGIVEDVDGYLWLITRGGGLSRFDSKTEQFDNFSHVQGDVTTLDSNQLNTISLGDNNTLWIGSNRGINRFDRISHKNTRLNSSLKPQDDATRENIDKIFQDNQQRLWFSVRRKGLYLHQPKTQNTVHFQHDATDQNSLDANVVSYIYQTQAGNMWIGTAASIHRFNPDSMDFERFIIPLKDNNKVKHASVTSIFEDKRGNLWIGSFYNGVSVLNTNASQVVNVNQGANLKDSLNALQINDIFQDNSETLWFVTPRSGLIKLVPDAMVFEHLLVKAKTSIEIIAIGESPDAKLVIKLADKQLMTVESATGQLSPYTQAFPIQKRESKFGLDELSESVLSGLGISANSHVSMIKDKQGVLWLGTEKGLSRVDLSRSKVTNFGQPHGLRLQSVTKGMVMLLSTGDIVMANGQGLVRFSPDALAALGDISQVASTILLTDFKLFNISVAPKSVDASSPLHTTINKTTDMTLSYQQNWFSIAFASSAYRQSEKLRYAYKMQGLSEQWIETDATDRIATFSSVAPGKYLFKVKVSDPNGQWQDNIRALTITITPPWWRTSLAYFLYVIATVCLLLLFNFLRTSQLRQRAARLEKGIEQRTIELKQRADTIAELLEDKDRLIANISHEFRTPLTLILGPLETQIKVAQNEKSKSLLTLAQANGQRLLTMVDQLLDMARLKDLPPSTMQQKDVLNTCHFLVESFRSLALLRDIQLSFECETNNPIYVQMQPDALEKILSNLLSNAFKYSADKEHIHLSVQLIEGYQGSEVMISVKDTGQGISDEDQKQVFKRFIRLKNNEAYVPGAGIGLALVKELVEQHQGSITVQSQLTVGSTFTVILPTIKVASSNQSEVDVNEALVISAVEQVNRNKRSQQLESPEPQQSDEQVSEQKVNILVIEDNQDMRRYIISCLEHTYACSQASDGEEGVKQAKAHLPDLIISDVMMPKMDGFEVTQTLKNNSLTSHIPIILLTAKGDSDSRMKGWSEKADEFLEKPFNTAQLLARIDNLLAIRRLLQIRFQQSFESSELAANKQLPSEALPTEPLSTEGPDSQTENAVEQLPGAHQAFIDQTNQVLDKHFADETFDVARFAVEMALSHRQLGRKIKALLDMTPAETIRNFRLIKAAEQLSRGVSPSVVAHQVGFGTHSYFSQCFKAKFGCLPKDFKNNQ